ncbi:MAG: thiamine pyrophosphate-dependent enzyme, partial [Muribaculaceae bacterium]
SETPMTNPNFVMLANAYGIAAENVETREEIDDAINRMIKYKGSYILNVNIDTYGMVFPMIPAGGEMTNILLTADEKYKHD